MTKHSPNEIIKRWGAGSIIFLSFIVAFEIVIMISPFAFFFYAVFNPFLITLNQSDLTRWLTAFFLPHMILPPNGILLVIRILGSVFFVIGMLIFFVCALQVYLGKLFKKGTATKGLYVVIRHPQYAGLSLAAVGLAIMWPRFLTLVLLAVMIILYYFLAKDEERRMSNRFAESYNAYMNRTGMFLPRKLEKIFVKNPGTHGHIGIIKSVFVFLLLLIVTVGSGFALRIYTVQHLPLEKINKVDVITIMPEDLAKAQKLLPAVLQDSLVSSKLESVSLSHVHHRILAYFIPIDYLMQGMIANTGTKWKLFERHKTIGMITDYIFHPFAHLTGMHTHRFININNNIYNHPMTKRRIIFIDITDGDKDLTSPFDDFNINVKRTPVFFADINILTEKVLQVRNTPSGSGWGTVPTPMF